MNNTDIKKDRIYKGDSLIEILNDYTVIDIETTGLDPSNDKIIELAAVKVKDNKIIDTYSTLINPEIEIDSFITNLTKITNEMLTDAPTIDEKINEYINFIGEDVILGHNINFDINFLYDNYQSIKGMIFTNDYVDTLRISKNFIKDVPNYKLKTLSEKFEINYDGAHRSLKDCYITNNLYIILKDIMKLSEKERIKLVDNIVIEENNPLKKLKIAIKGRTKNYSKEDLIRICRNNKIKVHSFFYSDDYDLLVLSNKKYQNYLNEGRNEYYESHSKKIIGEYEFYNLLGLEINNTKIKKDKTGYTKAKDIVAENLEFDENNPLFEKECVFTGTLERMTRKEAMQLVANLGGKNRDTVTNDTNFLVLGNNDYCSTIKNGKSSKQQKAEKYKLKGNDIEIISENVFYDMIEDYIDN